MFDHITAKAALEAVMTPQAKAQQERDELIVGSVEYGPQSITYVSPSEMNGVALPGPYQKTYKLRDAEGVIKAAKAIARDPSYILREANLAKAEHAVVAWQAHLETKYKDAPVLTGEFYISQNEKGELVVSRSDGKPEAGHFYSFLSTPKGTVEIEAADQEQLTLYTEQAQRLFIHLHKMVETEAKKLGVKGHDVNWVHDALNDSSPAAVAARNVSEGTQVSISPPPVLSLPKSR